MEGTAVTSGESMSHINSLTHQCQCHGQQDVSGTRRCGMTATPPCLFLCVEARL